MCIVSSPQHSLENCSLFLVYCCTGILNARRCIWTGFWLNCWLRLSGVTVLRKWSWSVDDSEKYSRYGKDVAASSIEMILLIIKNVDTFCWLRCIFSKEGWLMNLSLTLSPFFVESEKVEWGEISSFI